MSENQSSSTPPPPQLGLQLATLTDSPPSGSDWLHEIKFDGYRVAAYVSSGEVTLLTRNQLDWTGKFPGVARSLASLKADSAVLDGEIVALTADGRADFGRLQAILSGSERGRLHYQVFDLLWLDGTDLRSEPLSERREILSRLLESTSGTTVRLTGQLDFPGEDVFGHACRLGLEGIVSKRTDSEYRAGRQTDWLKTVCLRNGDFVILGFTQPGGSRNHFGALLLGEYTPGAARPQFVGKVGTGFSRELLADLHARMLTLERSDPLVEGTIPREFRRGTTWTEPELVVEIAYSDRTSDNRLRHPRFRRLREDKPPLEAERSANEVVMPKITEAPKGTVTVAGVALSNPGRVLYPEQGVSKQSLAEYYEAVGEEQLRWLAHRPLSLVRCPEGQGGSCFYQKHPGAAFAEHIPRVSIEEEDGFSDYLYVRDTADVVGLVQAGVLEIHAWGSVIETLEQPDILVFDLDPSGDVPFALLKQHARELRDLLKKIGLTAFLRATGGKGLHLVVPIEPDTDWDAAKSFSKAVAQTLADTNPEQLTVNMSKDKRQGRVFIDYLRNGRGSTAITNWSTRSRQGAPVAVPLRWDELGRLRSPNAWNPESALRRLRSLKSDAWEGFDDARVSLQKVVEP